jgi:hypothetical protein
MRDTQRLTRYTRPLAVAALLGYAACAEADFLNLPNVAVTITPHFITVQRLDSLQLQVVVTDSAGNPVARAVTYSVGNPSLISVNSFAVVTSLGPVGTTTLVANVPTEHVSDTAIVTVGTTATSITLAPADTLVAPSATFPYHANVLDAHGVVPGGTFTLSAGVDSGIAVVSGDSIHAVGPSGDVAVTGTSGSASGSGVLTVLADPSADRIGASGHPSLVAATGQGKVFIERGGKPFLSRYDAAAHQALASLFVPTGIVALATDSAASRIYFNSSFTVKGLDPAQGIVTDTFSVGSQITGLAVSPDDKLLLVATVGDHLLFFNRTTHALSQTISATAMSRFAACPAGDSLVYGIAGGGVIEINTKTLATGRSFGVGSSLSDLAVSADGTRLYAADANGHRIAVWNLTTGAVADSILLAAAPQGVALAADGTQLWVTIPSLGEALVFDPSTLDSLRTVTTGGSPRGIRLGPTGTNAVIANDSGWIDIVVR